MPAQVDLIQHGPEGVENRDDDKDRQKNHVQAQIQTLRQAKRATPHAAIEPQRARALEGK